MFEAIIRLSVPQDREELEFARRLVGLRELPPHLDAVAITARRVRQRIAEIAAGVQPDDATMVAR